MDKSKQSVSIYDKIAIKYTELYFNETGDFPFVDKFLNKLPKNGKILEVGCGAGHFSNYMAEKGFVVEGIDLSKKFLEIAKEKVPNVIFKYMDMRKLEYLDEEFDGVLSTYALIHIPTDEVVQTLQESFRVLKPGGMIFIAVHKGEPDKMVDEPLKKGEKIFLNQFSKERLSKFVIRAGFKVDYVEIAGTTAESDLGDEIIYMIGSK